MSGQVSRGSAGVYHADDQADVARLSWPVSGSCRAVQLASIRQMSGQVSRGSAGEYQANEQAGVARFSWRVSGRNLDRVLKNIDITLSIKVLIVKAVVFPVVIYGCEGWTIKKAEHQRIDAFELWCWRRLLRVSWTARRSSQSSLKEINPKYSLDGLMLKLKP